MRKITAFISVLALSVALTLTKPSTVWASEQNTRELKLKLVLESYDSPLVGLESELIETAELYDLDWTLLAAISGVESSFAKRMPYNCNNPFGWGITGSKRLCFDKLENAIYKVGNGIGTKYNTNSLSTIAKTYNPGNYKDWAAKTQFFMNKIKNQDIPASLLPIEF